MVFLFGIFIVSSVCCLFASKIENVSVVCIMLHSSLGSKVHNTRICLCFLLCFIFAFAYYCEGITLIYEILFCRSLPNGEPDVTNSDISAIRVVEKQPDFSPLTATDTVTVQPKLSTPLLLNISPEVTSAKEPLAMTKEQPKSDRVNEEPLAITIPPEVKQPPMPVMYGRGATPKAGDKIVAEPGLLIIRDNAPKTPKYVDVTPTDQVTTVRTEPTKTESVPKFRPELDLSPDGIERDGKQRIKKAPTWSPELSDEVLSTKDLLSETFHGIVGATASAATAVYEGVSNAFNSGDKLPNVKYQNDHVIISHKDGSIEGIPRPLQVGFLSIFSSIVYLYS